MQLSRRNFLKTFGSLIAGGLAAVGGSYGYGRYVEAKSLTIERVQIPVKNLKPGLEGFKIVQLSDIHLHPYTQLEFVREVVKMANTLQPDLTVLTGDYVQQSADSIFDLAPVLARLDARYGVFSILGNHDLWTDADVVRQGLEEERLPVLRNRGLALDVGNALLYLAGLDDGWSGQPNLSAAMENWLPGLPTLLLAHEPDLADTFSRDGRITLQLSGHSHGGQVRLPGLGAPILPTLGRKYDQGLYQVNDLWLYTNRGVGLIVPLRLNCPPEITEITLVGA